MVSWTTEKENGIFTTDDMQTTPPPPPLPSFDPVLIDEAEYAG